MRQIREVLRLRYGGLNASTRAIGRQLGIGRTTVDEYLDRAGAAGLSWPLPAGLTDQELERRLFVNGGVSAGRRHFAEPDWAAMHAELRRPGVVLMTLWDEYRQACAESYSCSRFGQLYCAYEKTVSVTMRQVHVAGDKVFVDFSGKRLPVVDPQTGEVRAAELFVGVLGASSYTYAEATWSQGLPEWIDAHVHMFAYFRGSTRVIVPDNLKSGVHKPSFYDPEINRSYSHMAEHYRAVVLPARPYHPKDKGKVEAGVRLAQIYILGRLRNVTFFSLEEANGAIREALERLNATPMRRLGRSRRQIFDELDHPALQPLPEAAYEFAEWKVVRVGPDYHVQIDGFAYSVPFSLARQQVEVRATAGTVEIFSQGTRVAAHARRSGGHGQTTLAEHMPANHRHVADWNAARFLREAAMVGPTTAALVGTILASKRHQEQAFRTCQGVLRLLRGLPTVRAETVASHAVAIGATSYGSIASIVKTGMDTRASQPPAPDSALVHSNIRGSRYFH
jgi:transposase